LDSAPVATATAELPSPPTTASCLPTSTRHACNGHSCATSLAGAWTLAPRARQLRGRPPPHGRRCQPAATSVPRTAHAATGPAPYPLALGPEEKSITTFPTFTVELPPLHSSPPSPPSTAASSAPPAPSTPPVASPELEVALYPHQSRQPTPADHFTDVPLRPTAHRRRATATVSLPPPFALNRSHHRPGPLPGRFPADQRRSAGRISPVSHRRRGGGGISLPCFLSWAEMPSRLGRNVE
jgi:hypothetical protein